MNLHEKKSGFLNKVLRPRSLRSLAPPTAFGRWRRVGLLGLLILLPLKAELLWTLQYEIACTIGRGVAKADQLTLSTQTRGVGGDYAPHTTASFPGFKKLSTP